MASLTAARALAGARAFLPAGTTSKPRRGPAPLLARRDSFMVEVGAEWELPRGCCSAAAYRGAVDASALAAGRALSRRQRSAATHIGRQRYAAPAGRTGAGRVALCGCRGKPPLQTCPRTLHTAPTGGDCRGGARGRGRAPLHEGGHAVGRYQQGAAAPAAATATATAARNRLRQYWRAAVQERMQQKGGHSALEARRQRRAAGQRWSDDEARRRMCDCFLGAPAPCIPPTQLRARRHKESKIETYKRKLQERAQARRCAGSGATTAAGCTAALHACGRRQAQRAQREARANPNGPRPGIEHVPGRVARADTPPRPPLWPPRMNIVDPTWDEFYGENSLFDNGVAPFEDFFRSPDDDLDVFDVSAAARRRMPARRAPQAPLARTRPAPGAAEAARSAHASQAASSARRPPATRPAQFAGRGRLRPAHPRGPRPAHASLPHPANHPQALSSPLSPPPLERRTTACPSWMLWTTPA
jgi:hypothetical protein